MSDIISEFEDGLVLLSKAVRKVRTQEGASFYGLPIGAPITADIINKKNAEKGQKGIKPPAGAIDNEVDAPPTPPTPGTATPGLPAPTTPDALGAAQPGGDAPKPPKIKKSELKGNKHFKVGKSKYTAPAGSKLIRPVDKPEIAYVLTPDGKVHAFVEKGEAEVSPTLSKSLAQRFQGDLTNDEKFQEEEFEATSSPYSMGNLGTGSVLTDVDGNPQFVKQADGTWLNEELDVALDEKDVSPFFESGELVPQASASDAATQEAFPDPEVTSFVDMDKNEFDEALNGFPTGYKLSLAAASPEGDETVFTKAASGKWVHSADGLPYDSGTLYYLKSKLGVKSQESFEEPEATPELDELDNLLSAKRIKERQPAVGKPATPEWLDSAPEGAQLEYTSGADSSKSLWTKQNKSDWKNDETGGLVTADLLKDAISYEYELKITKLEADPEPEETPEPEKAPVEPLADWEKELLGVGDKAQADMEKAEKEKAAQEKADAKAAKEAEKAKKAEEQVKKAEEEAAAAAKAAEEQAAAEAAAAEAAKQVPAPGEKFTNMDQLDSMAIGDKAVWTSSYGSTDSYTKVSADSWESQGGSPVSKGSFSESIKKGYLTYEPKAGELKDGDLLKSKADLEKIAVGDKALYNGTVSKYEYTKTSPELFMDGNVAMTIDDLAYDAVAGMITFKKGNSATPQEPELPEVSEADEPQAAPSNDLSDELDVQFYAGAPAVSQKTVQEGIDLLEGFSGFQIKYAFKNNKDHPLVQPEMLAELKDASSKAHPDLKPKQALIAYLKDKIGVKTEAPKETEKKNSDAPKINLGSRAPESGVQGFDGGEFTAEDVQGAIDILENFPGKLMKAELNKKGNALGSLDPNKLVGFDKDKLVTKQKLIDLLKIKLDKHKNKQSENEEVDALVAMNAEAEDLPEVGFKDFWDDMDAAVEEADAEKTAAPMKKPVFDGYKQYRDGTKLTIDQTTNGSSKQYTYDKKEETWFDSDGLMVSPTTLDILANHPDTTYALDAQSMVPEYAKTPRAVLSKTPSPAKAWSTDEAENAPVGIVFKNDLGYTLTKNEKGQWSFATPSGNVLATNYSSETVKSLGSSYVQDFVPEVAEAPAAPEFNKSGLTPGKYSTTSSSKAYMVVQADGKGIYVNGKGVASKMSANAVKKNHDAGMNVYGGLPEDVPEPAKAVPAEATKPVAKKKATTEVKLEDGTYYVGSANNPKATVYEVENGMVTIYKNGSTSEPQPISKLKTNYLKGKIMDKDGNSVLPDGHEGLATFWNVNSDLVTLGKLQKLLEENPDIKLFDYSGYSKVSNLGISFDYNQLGMKIQTKYPDLEKSWYQQYSNSPEWHEAAYSMMTEDLSKFLEGHSVEPPEANTAALFDWEMDGVATMPANTVENINVYGPASLVNPYMKKVSENFGNGKIFSFTGMGKYEKGYWINAYKEGNFAYMYQLEVQGLASKGKAHPAGYLHPGYEGNAGTNKITWGAAVPGEFPAGKAPEGSWSSISTVQKWAKEEIDNYLIAANMKYPEHLTASERRNWVKFHINGAAFKSNVDALSIKAKLSADAGNPPQTDTPVWTENIVPTKSYTFLFDDGPYVTAQQWGVAGYEASNDWWTENIESNAEFKTFVDDFDYDSIGYNKDYYTSATGGKQNIIGQFHQAKYDDYQAELLKPVWKKKKALAPGSHDVWLMENQFGKLGIFKPVEGGPEKNFRAEVENAANLLSKSWGFNTPGSQMFTSEDGEYGQLQDFSASVGDFHGKNGEGIDFSTLTDKQLGQTAAEHVLDWILDNDDTHGENLLIGADGNLVGIDKGRAFYVYGNWNGLSADQSANSNASLVYTRLYNAIRDKSITKEQADAAYLGAMKAAKRIQKSDPTFAVNMIKEGTKNRTKWAVPGYMTHFDHTQAPQNQDALIEAFLARKESLVTDVEAMWAKVYSQAGLELPEPPVKAINEDHLSGWDEPDMDTKVEAAQHWGVSALHQSASIVDGHSLLWEEKTSKGETSKKGKFQLGILAQEKMLEFLGTKVKGGSVDPGYESTNVPGFPNGSSIKSAISHAAKNWTKNIVDKNFDEDIWNLFETTKTNLNADLEQWDPDMPAKNGFHHFDATSTDVPEGYLYQYKMALEHYQGLAAKVDKAKADGEPTNKADYVVFTPTAVKKKPKVYTHEDGKSYTELTNGQYLFSDGTLGKMDSLPADVKAGNNGWTSNDAPETPNDDPVNYALKNATGTVGSVDPATGVKTISDVVSGDGHGGKEYIMTLPTGEVIRFRNSDKTNTYRTQSGTVNFELTGDDAATSLSRVQAHLEVMGLDLTGSDEDAAETVYWRQQFQSMFLRNQSDLSPGAKSAVEKLETEFNSKNKKNHPRWFMSELVADGKSVEEEKNFWKDLANEAFGADKVSEWVSNGKHLPRYSHMNLHNVEESTGAPIYDRIDVDKKELFAKGKFIAIGNNGKDQAVLNYITTGGMLSTEERLRTIGFKTGASSEADQGSGGASSVFTRVANGDALTKGAMFGSHVVYWSPEVLAHTSTYSYQGDDYGRWDNMYNSPNKVTKALDFKGGSNETMVKHSLSIFDYMEVMAFDDATKRNEAIQRMKAMGIETLRGLPIEDRLVMRDNLKAALEKAKAQWQS